MKPAQHDELVRSVADLRTLLGECSTSTIVGSCAAYWMKRGSEQDPSFGLLSPARQWSFLLSLMLMTPEPHPGRNFTEEDLTRSHQLLDSIFSAYAWTFFSEPGEVVDDEWVRIREVAMPTFLDYFNQGVLASTEQIARRIERYLTPFDSELASHNGLSASDALTIARWIGDQKQKAADELPDRAVREREVRTSLLQRMKNEGWNLQQLRAAAEPEYHETVLQLSSSMDRLLQVSLSDLVAHFGHDRANAFWSLFAATRGEAPPISYPTEQHIAEERSLYCIEPGTAICPLANQLYLAILSRFERHLAEHEVKERYFKRRDKILEQEAQHHFSSLLKTGRFFPAVFETPDNQFEHDLVVQLNDTVLVIEAKASPPVEPFRDPDRAFTRIRRSFQSNRGIQSAYNQGHRLWTHWKSGKEVRLYDHQGNLAVSFDQSTVSCVLVICVTRDSFGSLAADLSRMLEKRQQDPYPWCVNVLDLEAIADAWNYFNWGVDKFLDYLHQRERLHGKVFTSDELEFVGFYITHGGLHWIHEASADHIQLDPTYSGVFDRIYRARLGAGPPVRIEPKRPVFSDLRQSLLREQPSPAPQSALPKKQGRNEPCACGSGKKYKRCCLR